MILISGAFYYTLAPSTKVTGKASMVSYEVKGSNISFEYPSNLFLYERKTALAKGEKSSLMLVENTQENINVLTGKDTSAREGPTAISLSVYENPKKVSAVEFIQKEDIHDTWNLSDKKIVESTVGTTKAYSYVWDGLYRGKTTVIAKGEYVYVFSVTFLTEDDQLLRDEQMILNSTVFK